MNYSTVPAAVEGALQKAADKLGRSLEALNYPNGGKDAVFAETNLLVYLGHGLMDCEKPFHCYAEASHTNGRRIDMIAFDGDCALAVEAKKFGNVGYVSISVEADLRRLADFCPGLSPNTEGSEVENWWEKASEHWGLILIGSHGGDAVCDAWKAKRGENVEHCLQSRLANLGPRRKETVSKENDRLIHLLQSLDQLQDCRREAISICSGKTWKRCADAYLLWAAFRLDGPASAQTKPRRES